MTHNFLKTAFPDFWLTGTNPGAPLACVAEETVVESAGIAPLAEHGADRRAFEPMGKSRWGDNLDVILSNAPPQALDRYKLLVVLGDLKLDSRLRPILRNWVEAGGTLLLNAKQVEPVDEPLLGVKFTGRSREANRSRLAKL